APTQTGRHGRPVLSPSFVEWLMGLPAGWVCEIGLPRTVALRVLGNGVVPHQAAAALRALLVWHLDRGTTR
ncbi:MAG: DNA cytosine methyltransferase, partial [Dactylosporangium sp.]|nr:DNA cytosine methyltransferase [Dactylosporangium sp.]